MVEIHPIPASLSRNYMEKLTALCEDCNCCLADSTHCWNCHTTKSVKTLCGCGECVEKLKTFKALDKERENRRRLKRLFREDKQVA